MTTEKAIKTMEYNKHLLGLPDQGNAWKANANTIACDIAITALRENLAREKGCEWCAGNTEWQPDLLDGCKGGYRKPKFCPECGEKQDADDHIGEVTEMMQAAPSNAAVKTLKEYYDDFKTPEELRKPGYDRNDPKGSVME